VPQNALRSESLLAYNVQAPRRPAPVLANDTIKKAMIDDYDIPSPGAGWSEYHFPAKPCSPQAFSNE
jgi:hypothetical protein